MATPKKPIIKQRALPKRESPAVAFLRATATPGGFGAVVAIDPMTGMCTGQGYTLDTLADAERFITAAAAGAKNLYWTPNPLKGQVNKKPLKSDVERMRWAHLDLDDASDDALQRLRDYPLPPTLIVFSGGGYNAYWELEESIYVNGNIADLEAVNKKLIADFNGDKGTHNLDRILRLPNTINYPTKTKIARGRVPIEARRIEHHSDRVYSLEQFGFPLDEVNAAQPAPPKADSQTDKKVDRSKDLLRKVPPVPM